MKRRSLLLIAIISCLSSFACIFLGVNSARGEDNQWSVTYGSPDPDGNFSIWMDEAKDYGLENAEVTFSGDNFELADYDDDGDGVKETKGILSKKDYSGTDVKDFPDAVTIRYPNYGVKVDGTRTDLIFEISNIRIDYKLARGYNQQFLIAYSSPDATGMNRLQISAQGAGKGILTGSGNRGSYIYGNSRVKIKFVEKNERGEDIPVKGLFKFLFTDIDVPDYSVIYKDKDKDPDHLFSKDGTQANQYAEHFTIVSGQRSNVFIPVSKDQTCMATNATANSIWRKSLDCPPEWTQNDVPEKPTKSNGLTAEQVQNLQLKVSGTVLLDAAGTELEWGGAYAKTALFSSSTVPTDLRLVGKCENPTDGGATVTSEEECVGGSVTNIGEKPIIKGFTREYKVTPMCGYQIDKVTYRGENIPLKDTDRSYFVYAPTEFNETERDSDGVSRSIFTAGFRKIPTPSAQQVAMVATATPKLVTDPTAPLTLTFKITNNADIPLAGYHINYSLSAVDQEAVTGTVAVPTISAHQSGTVQVQVTPGAATYAGYDLNAQLSMCDTENTSTIEEKVPADYQAKITKTADRQVVNPGESVTYTVLVENIGKFKGTFTVQDILPETLIPLNITQEETQEYKQIPVDRSGNEVTSNPAGVKFTNLTLEPGAKKSFTITAQVKEGTLGGSISNTASLTSEEKPQDPPKTSTTTVTYNGPVPPANTMPMTGSYAIWGWAALFFACVLPGLYFLLSGRNRK